MNQVLHSKILRLWSRVEHFYTFNTMIYKYRMIAYLKSASWLTTFLEMRFSRKEIPLLQLIINLITQAFNNQNDATSITLLLCTVGSRS